MDSVIAEPRWLADRGPRLMDDAFGERVDELAAAIRTHDHERALQPLEAMRAEPLAA